MVISGCLIRENCHTIDIPIRPYHLISVEHDLVVLHVLSLLNLKINFVISDRHSLQITANSYVHLGILHSYILQ